MLMNGTPDTTPIFSDVARREAERSEADRSGTSEKIGAASPPPAPRPNPEFAVDARRRTFTLDYKLRILEEADAAAGDGATGALLRREGLYSSHLSTWRRERQEGTLYSPRKRGPLGQPADPQGEELRMLRLENERLAEELRKAHFVIDVQKKVALLWEQQAGPERRSS